MGRLPFSKIVCKVCVGEVVNASAEGLIGRHMDAVMMVVSHNEENMLVYKH